MAHLTIRRNKKNAIPFNESLKSGFMIEYARAWRRERAGYIAAIVTSGALALLPFLHDLAKRVFQLVGFHQLEGNEFIQIHSAYGPPNSSYEYNMIAAANTIICYNMFIDATFTMAIALPAFFLLINFTRDLIMLSRVTCDALSERRFHYEMFRHVDIEEEYPRYMHSLVMNQTNHLYNLLLINDYFETRLNWLSVNACPKLKFKIGNIAFSDARIGSLAWRFSVAKDVTAGFGYAMFIFSVIFCIIATMSIASVTSSILAILVAIPVAVLVFLLTIRSYPISYLSYKAAFIKLLSDAWPWETDKLRYDATKPQA